MPILSPFQMWVLIIGSWLGGACLMFLAFRFYLDRRNTRPPRPPLMTFLARYKDMLYDGRFIDLSDREISNQLRDATLVVLWLSSEMTLRVNKKLEREELKRLRQEAKRG